METPDWTLVFGGYEVKQDCPLRTRRRLAGLHQIQTSAGSASTTWERMSLLLDRLEHEDANEYTLYHHITVMLEEALGGVPPPPLVVRLLLLLLVAADAAGGGLPRPVLQPGPTLALQVQAPALLPAPHLPKPSNSERARLGSVPIIWPN